MKKGFYVDDLLTGTQNIQEALILNTQLVDLLKKAGFKPHKWTSSKQEHTCDATKDENTQIISLEASSVRKLLGTHWMLTEDVIKYLMTDTPMENHSTRRIILSRIAQLFDPLGLLGPIIIEGVSKVTDIVIYY